MRETNITSEFDGGMTWICNGLRPSQMKQNIETRSDEKE